MAKIDFRCDCGCSFSADARRAGTQISCIRCDADVLVPYESTPDSHDVQIDNFDEVEEPADTKDEKARRQWLLQVAIWAGTGIAVLVQLPLRGPDFLVLYGIFGLLVFAAGAALRAFGCSKGTAAISPILAFELLGVVRWIYGSAIGMTQFSMLHTMMMLGGIFLLFIAADGSSGGGGMWVGGGCGSSCGGGGCGGGGCGGCGN